MLETSVVVQNIDDGAKKGETMIYTHPLGLALQTLFPWFTLPYFMLHVQDSPGLWMLCLPLSPPLDPENTGRQTKWWEAAAFVVVGVRSLDSRNGSTIAGEKGHLSSTSGSSSSPTCNKMDSAPLKNCQQRQGWCVGYGFFGWRGGAEGNRWEMQAASDENRNHDIST